MAALDMDLKLFRLLLIFMALNAAVSSSTFGASNRIPLPGENEIKKYFVENINRFNHPDAYPECDFAVSSIIKSYIVSRIFSKCLIFEVNIVGCDYLEIGGVNSFGSRGYFATNGKEILYLNHSNVDNIEKLLNNEKMQIDEKDAFGVSLFLSEMMLADGPRSYNMMRSTSDLFNYALRNEGYEVNKTEIEKFENVVHAPKISGNKESGWEIEFYTFGGWLNEVTTISKHIFQISMEYKIKHKEEVLTTQAFSKLPNIIY